jgi:hypothetical protein
VQTTYQSAAPAYPVHLEGRLDRPSRGLWLVKWLLLVPHFIVLAFLWLAFALLSVVAFVVLFFGGHYPPGIFDFNVGVLRWTWRVSFYAFNANGTDRYPPFTLADVPEYPARFEIEYPQNQRHGLPLIGWWLAGIPQYIVTSIFAGAGTAAGWNITHTERSWQTGSVGLIGILVFFGVIVLLFRGAYPRSIFDFVLGLNRWVLRVGAYGALMVREYPPFRLDAGETDPGGMTLTASPTQVESAIAVNPAVGASQPRAWGAGRVIGVVVSAVVMLVGLSGLVAGTGAVVFDQTQRNSAGYLMTDSQVFSTPGYAFVSKSATVDTSTNRMTAKDILGNVRIRVQSQSPVFVGIGPSAQVDQYLRGARSEVAGHGQFGWSGMGLESLTKPAGTPTSQDFWVAKTSGSGVQTLTWSPRTGDWRVVLMNADASAGVRSRLAVGAELPGLVWMGVATLAGGALLFLLGGLGLYLAVRRRTYT